VGRDHPPAVQADLYARGVLTAREDARFEGHVTACAACASKIAAAPHPRVRERV